MGLRAVDGLDAPHPRRALIERTAIWRPYRSVASWYLWRVVENPALFQAQVAAASSFP